MRLTGLAVVLVLTALLIPAAVTPGFDSATTIGVVNQSSLTTTLGGAFTATIRDGRYGPELVVSGRVGDRTTTGEHLFEAVVEVIVTQADGSQLWAGSWAASPDGDFEWRVAVKPFGVLDGSLIAHVTLRDREVLTVEARERMEQEARRQEEVARRQKEAERAEELAKEGRRAEAEQAAEAARVRAAREAEAKRELDRQAKIRGYGWPKDIESAVIGRTVMPGMTAEQVTLAWGPPRHVNQTIRASGISELNLCISKTAE